VKILLVEDDRNTILYLQQGLAENGFIVDVASDGNTGLNLLRERAYDLVILDVMLPGKDGWSVLRDARGEGRAMPVLFLTARDGVDDRVKGLELGADDYLIKPFAFSALLARVRTLLRRTNPPRQDVLHVADLEIDLARQKATRAGKRLELRPKELALLILLTRRAGEVLSRTYIAEQVWDINFESDSNVVDVHVRRLRAKVDDPFELKLIHTVWGAGYVLEDRS